MHSTQPRIFRVHGSDYYGDEVMDAPQTHSDDALAAVARMGFDSVWLHSELREIAPTALFRHHVHNAEIRLAALSTVVERARRHGLGVWLYLNEPRGFPRVHPFWEEHPECRGETGSDTAISWRRGPEWLETYAMCLGAEPVRTFLRESVRDLVTAVPHLAGAFVITASEHHTHCHSHLHMKGKDVIECPRCANRDPLQAPVEIARAMQAGLDDAGSAARLAFWTWSWGRVLGPDPQQPLLDALPPQVALLSDFERGVTVQRLGKPLFVDEYSLAVVGPSPRFSEYREAIRASGRTMWAKLQVGTTHELATVPNIPVPGVLYDKVVALREHDVAGVMATWTMGLRPTLNSHAAGQLLAHEGALPSRAVFLAQLARDYFGSALSDADTASLVAAWEGFAVAMAAYPATMEFVYFAPVNYAPAYPWKLQRERTRMARTWTTEPWGDYLEMACGPFSPADMGAMMDAVATLWLNALAGYEAALEPLAQHNAHAREELSTARACGLFFRSTADRFLFAAAVDAGHPVAELLTILDRELATCARVLPVLENDERIGWHDEVRQRMADPAKVRAKIEGLQQLREQITMPLAIAS